MRRFNFFFQRNAQKSCRAIYLMQNWTLIRIMGNIRNLPLKITETATAARKLNRLFGEYEIEVSRDCERSFEPALVAKRHNIIEGLENIIISFYAEGMSVSDIEK